MSYLDLLWCSSNLKTNHQIFEPFNENMKYFHSYYLFPKIVYTK